MFVAFLRLGCFSFGGPIAHLGYFRGEFVERRRWCSESTFAEIIAIAQSLPGPASSEVAFAIGLLRARLAGGLAAWLGFTTPSAILMLAFASGHNLLAGRAGAGIVHGLQLVAVAVVAQAIVTMQRTLAPDRARMAFAVIGCAFVLFVKPSFGTALAIASGAVLGSIFLKARQDTKAQSLHFGLSKRNGIISAACFLLCLLVLPLIQASTGSQTLAIFDAFYRAGALVFGGGHVILPLLENAVVSPGWVSQQLFLSGYGAAQAIPGPLSSFAMYLGVVIKPNPNPILLGIVALTGIFLPGFLILIAVLPFWSKLRQSHQVQASIQGVNASVVGVLIAAFFQPVWKSTVHSGFDFLMALAAFILLTLWRLPPWMIVAGSAAASAAANLFVA